MHVHILSAFLAFSNLSLALAINPESRKSGGATSVKQNKVQTNVPLRLQWEENYGYCGEVSFISAGLYYGQYASQYDVRAIASNKTKQYEEDSQLLLGINDMWAASQLHLATKTWSSPNAKNADSFLSWVKTNVIQGFPTIIGVFENMDTFEGDGPGDPQYDHIVVVDGISSNYPLTDKTYHGNDTLTIDDNGNYTPEQAPVYTFSYGFDAFQATRKQANSDSHPDYSLLSGGQNFGTAITGVIDHDGFTLPVRVSTNLNYESPEIKDGSDTRPAAEALTLTVTVSGLRTGTPYNIFTYDNFSSVPDSSFNGHASNACQTRKVTLNSGSTYTFTENIQSNQIRAYRAVPASAP